MSDHFQKLLELVDDSEVILDSFDKEKYLLDYRQLFKGKTPFVLMPKTVDKVSEIMRFCYEHKIEVVPQGGNTGLCGGATPNQSEQQVILNVSKLNTIRSVDLLGNVITVEAGCILKDIQDVAEKNNRFFPLSLGSEGSCQIGGNIATNAGGTAVLRYGSMQEMVVGLEVVLSDGRIYNDLRSLKKDNTGYNLQNVFIGSEGTLGIITAAVLKLFPPQKEKKTIMVAMNSLEGAVEFFSFMDERFGPFLTAAEVISKNSLSLALTHFEKAKNPFDIEYPFTMLVEISSSTAGMLSDEIIEQALGEALEKEFIQDAIIGNNKKQSDYFWWLREIIVMAQRKEGVSIKNDISVPVASIPSFVKKASKALERQCPGIRLTPFGHIGDGNLHFNLMQPIGMNGEEFLNRWSELTTIVNDIVHQFQGSFSAEHGIGQLKINDLKKYRSDIHIELMQSVKKALDPKNILNPGKVVEKIL